MVMMVGELRRAESRSEVHELHQRRRRSLTGFTESRGEDSGHLVCRGAVGLALSPVLPANVYPVLVEVPPDGVHDGFVVMATSTRNAIEGLTETCRAVSVRRMFAGIYRNATGPRPFAGMMPASHESLQR